MQITHNSRELIYRKPFGARKTGEYVELHISVADCETPLQFVLLHYAFGLREFVRGKRMMVAKVPYKSDSRREIHYFGSRLYLPDEPGLFFYWFELRFADGSTRYAYADVQSPSRAVSGCDAPQIRESGEWLPQPFSITVYRADYSVPRAFAGRVMYQIFPDRFARSTDYRHEAVHDEQRDDERIYHREWGAEVDIHGKPPTGYIATDFFGGSLNGIREKLPHLQKLGIEVLYLNPIFRARSNHRYDTADYMQTDPLLGTVEDFESLCTEAAQAGIRIVLDGVFSHTGADSLYFNKCERFPGMGAYQATAEKAPSPYFSWYNLSQENGQVKYNSWWGFQELPAVNENDLGFREFILGEEGVVRTWLRRGAAGFRLDVSDELPDLFLRSMRRVIKDENPDALLMGEVWESAAAKVSYGHYRDFIFGNTHDCVMGYPFRQACVDFFAGRCETDLLIDRLETMREQYPPAAFASSMNLLSSHDVPRFITEVAGEPAPDSREEQAQKRLSPAQRAIGRTRLQLAYGLALLYPGMPSIYYGDERLMEGYRDPFNRRCFPWEQGEGPTEILLAALSQLRARYRVLQTGTVAWLRESGRLLHFFRRYESGLDLLGDPGKGPDRAEIFINCENTDRPISRHRVLRPYEILVRCGGREYCFSCA